MCNKLLAIDEDISIVYRSKREIAFSRKNGNFAWKRIYYKTTGQWINRAQNIACQLHFTSNLSFRRTMYIRGFYETTEVWRWMYVSSIELYANQSSLVKGTRAVGILSL